jgi:heptosyltransferase III
MLHTSYFRDELPQLMTRILLSVSDVDEAAAAAGMCDLLPVISVGLGFSFSRNLPTMLPSGRCQGIMASLVYHSGALGDFITTLPAIALWKDAHRGEPLILLGRPAHGLLAAHLFDEAWDAGAAEFSGLFSSGGSAGPRAVQRFSTITSALLFALRSSPLSAAFSGLGLRDVLRQDPFPPEGTHVVDYHLTLFEGRVAETERIPRIPAAAGASTRLGVAMHHGSGSPRKNWPRERFEKLSAIFAGRGQRTAWITGPAEDEPSIPAPAESWRSLALPELAERLAACRLFIGNDSGVTHLAAAMGCPTVALFGPSDHRMWSPRGPRVSVLRSATGRIEDIKLEDVLRVGLDFLADRR